MASVTRYADPGRLPPWAAGDRRLRPRMVADRIQPHRDLTHVRRAKNGKPASHPIRGDELRAAAPEHWRYVFETERGGPFTPDAVNRLVKRIGERAHVPTSRD